MQEIDLPMSADDLYAKYLFTRKLSNHLGALYLKQKIADYPDKF